ncbi:MAG: tRNA guanosine(34) transglycosylase Tgt [Planctomycetes bacterium]|nr:tRNA guanosine(34) transglycosylase Tgt [Planctomycetota bacterium]NOG53651.1 tRNA guanosine(34) transglycosylase Tgt [Planctomycetota bacterium]
MHHSLRFEILNRCATTHARCGRVTTPNGSFDTPAFMPVGTRASVKGLLPHEVAATGSQIILNNTYHLMLRPGEELIRRMGGVHRFMGWHGPILTDSGGYQVFSLSHINRIDEDGVTFRSIIDGSPVRLTPERSIQVQNALGSDIIMAFDDCPPGTDPADGISDTVRLSAAVDRTGRWLDRCAAAHERSREQALFGIVQGGTDLALRSRSVEQVCSIDLPGYAIGGVAVGEGQEEIARIVTYTGPLLPADRPRYLMGVGYERDILTAVRAGVDMFDCVLPTRNGRNGNAFTRSGQIRLRNAQYSEDQGPIEAGCDCRACAGGEFSRAYIRHLFISKEMLGPILVSLHNIRHFQRLMLDIRTAIAEDGWLQLVEDWPVLAGDGSISA